MFQPRDQAYALPIESHVNVPMTASRAIEPNTK